jgi:hypothetical protein
MGVDRQDRPQYNNITLGNNVGSLADCLNMYSIAERNIIDSDPCLQL